MPTKCCWVIHGSLTSERKASTSPSSFIITRPCCSIERSSAKLLVFTCTLKFERSTGSERVDALGRRAVEVIICMITRDSGVISMTSQASLSLTLSLYLSQKSLTHNIGSASALPIICRKKQKYNIKISFFSLLWLACHRPLYYSHTFLPGSLWKCLSEISSVSVSSRK